MSDRTAFKKVPLRSSLRYLDRLNVGERLSTYQERDSSVAILGPNDVVLQVRCSAGDDLSFTREHTVQRGLDGRRQTGRRRLKGARWLPGATHLAGRQSCPTPS